MKNNNFNKFLEIMSKGLFLCTVIFFIFGFINPIVPFNASAQVGIAANLVHNLFFGLGWACAALTGCFAIAWIKFKDNDDPNEG